jgi:ketosteroid isomerase-like protein
MSSEANKEIVAAIYAAFKAGDMPGLFARLADDIVWDVYGAAELPIAGSWTGVAAVAEWFDLLGGTSEVTLFEIDTVVGEGEFVAVFGRENGMIQATGRDYSIAWAHLWTLKDGRAVRFQDFLDGATITALLGDDGV